jgi:hypothetical protein
VLGHIVYRIGLEFVPPDSKAFSSHLTAAVATAERGPKIPCKVRALL